ncbi:cysteine-rich venom protein Mr30-like isoform X2 [Asterias rubens]|nr:cysteine-rich venom protein Mr30-like isoform X2 [Asterias rubens]XP_033630625.1 cysteine-rich venom protein Mr30-like isoform X2 [Asterias rubens]XP_033630626.1 cysteine-rich venom protein Mr30-like isoform X2 [Asterias rubens]XP_033630627.1 cysteine-rich venom protein Mr30-like isoform X2 [Asterias rubens]
MRYRVCVGLILMMIVSAVSSKRAPAVLSNGSILDLVAAPLLPGELNEGDGSTSMTPRDVQRTVDRHNEYRKYREASNMKHMTWDASLATMAQQWAERCEFAHGVGNNISPYTSIGQNLWLRTGDPNKPASGVIATDDWHDEIKDYNYENNYCGNVCGHYTQVVWAETDKVGCGIAFCNYISGNQNAWNIVCNYGPAGNYFGEKPYKTGGVCTDCPKETPFCYNGLCRLCNLEEAGCSCTLTCQNCGVLNKDKCYCECPNGFTGASCAEECRDNDPKCGANPGYPGPYACSWFPEVPKACPLMCGSCSARDPGFTCDPNQPSGGVDVVQTPDLLCKTVFDSVAMINGELNVIKGKKYWRFDHQGNLLSSPAGELLKNYHSSVKKGVKALYQITNGAGDLPDTITMIRGKKMTRFSNNRRRLPGWPINLYTDKGITVPIVAAVHDGRSDVTYMIAAKTSQVYTYDEISQSLSRNNPEEIDSIFSGVPQRITAAFRQGAYFYFVRGKLVYKVNSNTMAVEGAGQNFAKTFIGC